MHAKDALDIVAYLVGVGTTVVVVRSNIKKQTIDDLQDLVEVLQGQVAALRDENSEQAQEIRELKEALYGTTTVVHEGHRTGKRGQGSRNSTASPKTTKNRTTR